MKTETKQDFSKPFGYKEPNKFFQFIKNWGRFILLIIFIIAAGAEWK